MRRGVRLGLDFGKKRIGVSKCDADGILASPLLVVEPEKIISELTKNLDEFSPIEIIIGLPVDLRGEVGVAAQSVLEFAEGLKQAFPTLTIRLVDERLTTKVARGQLQQNGYSTKTDKHLIDAIAATVLLEDALEYERRTGSPPGQVLK